MKKAFILLALALMSYEVVAACQMSKPHSFDCQNDTFNGRIFPLSPLNFEVLNENWFSNQYTSQGSASEFQTIAVAGRPHRTCALLNRDRSRVGNMRFVMGRREIRTVQIGQFGASRRTFQASSRVSFENQQTVIFGTQRERFRCRIFVRARMEHLTCQYFIDGKFRGYLGFLPVQVSC